MNLLKFTYAIIQSFIWWLIAFFLIRLPVILLGFIVFPIAYIFRDGDSLPKWAWLWDNNEDGIYGIDWWVNNRNGGKRNFKTAYGWSVLRNPANNMRFIPFLSLNRDDWKGSAYIYGDDAIPHPREARKRGGLVWHLTLVRQGFLYYPSFWLIKATSNIKHFRLRCGWKCTPEWIDSNNLSETGKFSGITLQFMPSRDG